ncbi:XRE family transcriptional regulator [Nocardia sp. NPDC059228]|uniref:XRE family transcriptional regulator n=1 Tax=Nocardia sp. NPDC059228 TaxID=3346777 RepID=UPI0036CC9D60
MTEQTTKDGKGQASTRERKAPPYVSLRDVRVAAKLTLDDVRRRLWLISGREISNGTLSAVETGQRGASRELLADIEAALNLPASSISTTYLPRRRSGHAGSRA